MSGVAREPLPTVHLFQGALTSAEAAVVAALLERDIPGTRLTALLLVLAGACTILGLIQLVLSNVDGARQWLVGAGLAVSGLGLLGVLQRRGLRRTVTQEFRGSIAEDGVTIVDRGVPILHEWSVVRGVERSGRVLLVRLADQRVLPLSAAMFASVLEYESAAGLLERMGGRA